MSLSEELPIFKSSYDQLERIVDLEKDMPRMLRYALGEKLLDLCLDMLGKIYDANMTIGDDSQKHDKIVSLIISYRKLQMLLRVIYRRKAMSTGRYAELVKLLDSIGRQATGWKNHTKVAE